MAPKEAIDVAKRYVADVFSSEGTLNLGLEEIRFDAVSDIWFVTIGFTRFWDQPIAGGVLSRLREGSSLPRTFKTVEIAESDGRVLGLTHWPIAA